MIDNRTLLCSEDMEIDLDIYIFIRNLVPFKALCTEWLQSLNVTHCQTGGQRGERAQLPSLNLPVSH